MSRILLTVARQSRSQRETPVFLGRSAPRSSIRIARRPPRPLFLGNRDRRRDPALRRVPGGVLGNKKSPPPLPTPPASAPASSRRSGGPRPSLPAGYWACSHNWKQRQRHPPDDTIPV